MPVLCLRFPAGRYHATPADRHVNEGVVEWPPSPWRLLRALIACGYTALGWTRVPPDARRLVEALAGVLPRYRLPPAAAAHSRHYMPIIAGRSQTTTLVFDAWAAVGDGTIGVAWDAPLDSDALALLDRLLSHLPYLGRAESWVEAQLLTEGAELPQGSECVPCRPGEDRGSDWEQIRLLAPLPPQEMAQRGSEAAQPAGLPAEASGAGPVHSGRRRRALAAPAGPTDLIDALQWDTSRWRQQGWNQPPGSRWVAYWRPAAALAVAAPSRLAVSCPPPMPALLLALTTPSGRRGGLPPVTRTLPQAELLHRAVVSRLVRTGRPCPELLGKDDQGHPLTGHRHAHLCPLDLDGDGFLDHVLVHAPMGLTAAAQAILRSLRRTHTKGADDLQVAVAGAGTLTELCSFGGALGERLRRLIGPARSWRSLTPFVPPRHLKFRGRNTLQGQIAAELASRGLPPAAVAILPPDAPGARRFRHFICARRDAARAPPRPGGYAIRLTFAEPVPGPIALGYASHFGLGLFTVDDGGA